MEKKRKWYVREEQVITRFWEYEVETDTEEEAKRMVKDGEVEAYEYSWTDETDFPIEIVDVYEIDEE
jgi:hypothetical protein